MKDELLNLLGTCVSFHTIAGNQQAKQECLDWAWNAFFPKGSNPVRGVHNESPYLYLEHPGCKLLWFAHLDVIPAATEMFSMRIEGDRAFGRGVKDMKGAAVPFLMAYRDAWKSGARPPVSILLTTDEETAGDTIPTLISNGTVKAPVAFTPDTGSNPWMVVEHKGVIWANLVAHGKGAHGSTPWEANNPIPLLGHAIDQLLQAFPHGGDNDWQITIAPTKLEGSQAHNQIPETATCGLDVRFPPDKYKDAEEVQSFIEENLPEGCTIEKVLSADGLQTNRDHPMVGVIHRIAEEVTGLTIEIGREHGGTDARYFSAAGIPAFLYGPEGGGLHAPDEWVSIPSLVHQYEISRSLVQELESQ